MNRLKLNLTSLRHQLLLSFVLMILLTAAAIGLPALWLVRDQLNRQAWAQVDQASQAVLALYTARQNEMQNLATLTAERPTLRSLLLQSDQNEFDPYLQILRSGAELDLILVCDNGSQPLAQAGPPAPLPWCDLDAPVTYRVLSEGPDPLQLWLLASHPLEDDFNQPLGGVVVGLALDDAFARQMGAQTGLEHTLLWQGRALATSLEGGHTISAHSPASSLPQPALPVNALRRGTFDVGAQPFFANRFRLTHESAPDLEVEVALPVDNIVATRQQLAWILVGGIVAVTTLGSGLGLFLTRRISQPLARLTSAATKMSQGNLTSPIPADPRVREVALVAYALEAARLDLQSTLNDLRREKAWSNHLLESIVEGIVTLDERQRIIFFSQGAERITGWPREAVRGRSCDEIFILMNASQPFSHLLSGLERRTKSGGAPDGRQATLAFTGPG
ncbi:MAG: HAMP domain-containing protein [Anaerolineae bacterium]